MEGEQLEVTFEREVAEAAARAAERQGVSLSEWLNRLARQAAMTAEQERARRVEDALAAARELDKELGPLTPEEIAWADGVLDAFGIGRPAG